MIAYGVKLTTAPAQSFNFVADGKEFTIRLKTAADSGVYMDLAIDDVVVFYGQRVKANTNILAPYRARAAGRLYITTQDGDATWPKLGVTSELIYVSP